MLFYIIIPLEQKNLFWLVLDGKFDQGLWLKGSSRISIIV
jgi:hypothetical protein